MIPVVTFGRAAEYARVLRPGRNVYVEGYLRPVPGTDRWEVRAGQIITV